MVETARGPYRRKLRDLRDAPDARPDAERREGVTYTPTQIAERIENWFRGAHYVSVVVRRNGKDEIYEADFLKEVPRLLRPLSEDPQP